MMHYHSREEVSEALKQGSNRMRDYVDKLASDALTTENPKTNDAGESLQSVEETLVQRGNRYGEYYKVAEVSQDIKATLYQGMLSSGKTENDIPDYMWESIDMIANKLSRVVNGDPLYDDNWRDIAGYAQLVVDELNKDSNDDT